MREIKREREIRLRRNGGGNKRMRLDFKSKVVYLRAGMKSVNR